MQELKDALDESNDIGRVIKSHITIESLIHDFISRMTTHSRSVREMRLDYFGSVHLAVVLGLPSALAPALTSLGKLRNNFAHNLDQKLGKSEINSFYKSFPSEARTDINKTVREFCKEKSIPYASFSKLPVKVQFVVLSVHLYGFVQISIENALHEKQMRKLSRELVKAKNKEKEFSEQSKKLVEVLLKK